MKICTYRGLLIAVLTRNEHCPPHVHVGSAQWEARFQFSYWHNGVRLWDVVPVHRKPTVAILESLRQVLQKSTNLHRARECWWQSMESICLVNQWWDESTQEVIESPVKRQSTKIIQAAHFDVQRYRTILQLKGASSPVEIEL